MRISKSIHEGSRVLNKVTRETFVVRTSDGETLIAESEGEEIKSVKITEENAICYRLLYTAPAQITPAGYKLQDGILQCEGDPIVQGELRFTQILTGIKGALILISEDKSGEKSIYSYQPDRDRFSLRTSIGKAEAKVIYNDKDAAILSIVEAETVDETNQAGEVVGKKRVLKQGYLLRLTAIGMEKSTAPENIEATEVVTGFSGDGQAAYLYAKVVFADEAPLTVPSWYLMGTTEHLSEETIKVSEGEFFFASATVDASVKVTENGFRIGAIDVPYKGAYEKLIDTPFYVDHIHEGDTKTYVFTDETCCKVKKIAVKTTTDRGKIVTD